MTDYERKEQKIYDAEGEWIGVEITEIMTKEEAARRYPHIVFVDIPLPD